MTFKQTNLRTSRDWVDNKWVELKPKLDILHYVTGCTKAGASALLDPNTLKSYKVEAIGKGEKAIPGSGPYSSLLENVQGLDLRERLHHNNEDKAKKGRSNSLLDDFESAN